MTYSYREQLDLLKDISLAEGDRLTMNCPFCGGHKKFSMQKHDGRLLWNCFRASCYAKGSYQGKRSADAIRKRLEPVADSVRKTTPLPDITGSVWNHSAAVDYLEENHCMDAVQIGSVRVRYAPSENRVLFYTEDRKGALGRSLRLSGGTKWWTFGDVSQGYKIGDGSTAVLVEDIPSACSVSRLEGVAGIPLLGTTLGRIPSLNAYNSVILILDKDAASKAVGLVRRLGQNATTRFTEEDPKKMGLQELRELLG